MQFKDADGQAGWELRLARNQDGGYGAAAYQFTERWADEMERRMAEGATLIDIATEAERVADEGINITGFMYGCAVSILAKVWKHGEELRQWHNLETQIGDEGERANEAGGVLNPALLNISCPNG